MANLISSHFSNLWNAPFRVAALIRVTPSFSLSWLILGYFLILVLFTEGLIWFSSGKLGAFDWRSLVIYSCFGNLLWNLLQTRGLARELGDIVTNGRWFALGLIPMNSISVVVSHSFAKTLKSKPLFALCVILSLVHGVFGQSILEIVSAASCVYVGAVNITTLGIIAQLVTPRGYSGIVSSILANVFLIASGAVFPLTMITNSKYLFLLNPFAAAVAVPAGSLMKYAQGNLTSSGVQNLESAPLLGASLGWMVLLLCIAYFAERWRSHALYA